MHLINCVLKPPIILTFDDRVLIIIHLPAGISELDLTLIKPLVVYIPELRVAKSTVLLLLNTGLLMIEKKLDTISDIARLVPNLPKIDALQIESALDELLKLDHDPYALSPKLVDFMKC